MSSLQLLKIDPNFLSTGADFFFYSGHVLFVHRETRFWEAKLSLGKGLSEGGVRLKFGSSFDMRHFSKRDTENFVVFFWIDIFRVRWPRWPRMGRELFSTRIDILKTIPSLASLTLSETAAISPLFFC